MVNDYPINTYRMRGQYVHTVSEEEICFIASQVCKAIKITSKSFTKRKIGLLINKLEEYGINVDPVEDSEWIHITRATVDTQDRMIYMPRKLYSGLINCEFEAVRIFLHELGHIFLCHNKAILHFSDRMPVRENDSEWQADTFSYAMIDLLKIEKVYQAQLELEL